MTVVFIALYAAVTLALLPFAREPGPEMPGFNAAFAAGVFVAELATSFLLFIRFRQTLKAAVLLLANAYLFSALMAIAYLFAYPGAVAAGRPLIGAGQTISWIYNGWILVFALLALAAIGAEVGTGNAKLAGSRPRTIAVLSSAMVLVLAVALVAAVTLIGDRLPMLSAQGAWTSLNAALNYFGVFLFAAATAAILMALRTRSDLFLWLALALAAIAFGNLLSALGGGRYTVGWYACRLSWAASSCVLLLYFMAQFVRQHGLLVRTTDDLEERTRERDRIWNVSEDLLGVSTFEGYFISMNPAWTKVLGWSEDEIPAMHVSVLRHPDDAPHSVAGRARLAQGVPTVRMENRIRHKDGTWRWIAWTMTADEGLIYVAGRHVTAERQAQEALRQAEADAARNQKMEALGQLTGGVAHDFNNLLMVVSGFIPRVKKAVGHDPKAVQAAGAIEMAAQRGAALTRQLLSFSRRQPINPMVVELGPCVGTLRPLLAGTLGPLVDLQVEMPSGLWPVKIDANEFELALLNLILNARDAVEQSGTVVISARNVRLRPGETPENLSGEFVAVTVADTGNGIAPDILPKVFDPFFTTKQTNKGTGLGLSQVHGFTHQSGGTALIDSAPGKGTRVVLYLPRTEALPERTTPETVQPAPGGTALLVEDNADVAEVGREMLMQLGYEVEVAGNAERALEMLDGRSFDLVLSDIVMPGAMNGIELARAIRKRWPGQPIVLVTGYAAALGKATQEFIVLRKPYRFEELRQSIVKVSAGRPPA